MSKHRMKLVYYCPSVFLTILSFVSSEAKCVNVVCI